MPFHEPGLDFGLWLILRMSKPAELPNTIVRGQLQSQSNRRQVAVTSRKFSTHAGATNRLPTQEYQRSGDHTSWPPPGPISGLLISNLSHCWLPSLSPDTSVTAQDCLAHLRQAAPFPAVVPTGLSTVTAPPRLHCDTVRSGRWPVGSRRITAAPTSLVVLVRLSISLINDELVVPSLV